MTQVNIYEAKTQLSKLLALAEAGEEVVIARAGKAIARLVPIAARPPKRSAGGLKGLMVLAEDWDSPETNAEVGRMFESGALLPQRPERP